MRDKFESLLGKTLKAVNVSDDREQMTFETVDGEIYRLWHSQDCCESVQVEDVAGDLADLVGSPLLQAEEAESENNALPKPGGEDSYAESWTWTFYKLATIKGSVTIRWLGESNGYYSESVDFDRVAA